MPAKPEVLGSNPSGPAKTITTTKEVTEEVCQSATVTYVAVMVTGITIIATAVAAKKKTVLKTMRRRKVFTKKRD